MFFVLSFGRSYARLPKFNAGLVNHLCGDGTSYIETAKQTNRSRGSIGISLGAYKVIGENPLHNL